MSLIEIQSNVDISEDPMAIQRVREAAEKAKVELSTANQTSISLPYISAGASGPIHFETTLTRADFDRLTSNLVDRSIKPC